MSLLSPLPAGMQVSHRLHTTFRERWLSQFPLSISSFDKLDQLVNRRWTQHNANDLKLVQAVDITLTRRDNRESLADYLQWLAIRIKPCRLRVRILDVVRITELFFDAIDASRLERVSLELESWRFPLACNLLSRSASTLTVLTLDVCVDERHTITIEDYFSVFHHPCPRLPNVRELTIGRLPTGRNLNLAGSLLGGICTSMTRLVQLNIYDGAALWLAPTWSAKRIFVVDMHEDFARDCEWYANDPVDVFARVPRLEGLETQSIRPSAVTFLPRHAQWLKCGSVEGAMSDLQAWVDSLTYVDGGKCIWIRMPRSWGWTDKMASDWRKGLKELNAKYSHKAVQFREDTTAWRMPYFHESQNIFTP